MQFVVVRLGKDSITDINRLNAAVASDLPFKFTFVCAQVEEGISVGDYVFIWLGSDNNKGQPTAWKQGIRAIGRITSLARGESFNDNNTIEIEIFSVLPESVDQFDFLERSASHYKYFSKYPVVGIRSSRNNAIQKVNEDDRQKTTALLTALHMLFPAIEEQIKNYDATLLPLLEFVPVGNVESRGAVPEIDLSADIVWKWVTDEIFNKNERNFLFLGAPGTGKTWYAQEIAKQLAGSDDNRYTFVQFHPSFSYDDFVEGYTPKSASGSSTIEYSIKDKHFLNLCTKAKGDGSNLYVIVIDELSRGDPSRVFGELMTYLEVAHRMREFSLAYSGTKTFVPSNVIVIATANPYDRSVGELDDALVRRFVIREFPPDPALLDAHLQKSGVEGGLIKRLIHVFQLINQKLPNGFGHAHFWSIRSEQDFRALWASRIQFLLRRAFLFDEESLIALRQEVDDVFPLPEQIPSAPEVVVGEPGVQAPEATQEGAAPA